MPSASCSSGAAGAFGTGGGGEGCDGEVDCGGPTNGHPEKGGGSGGLPSPWIGVVSFVGSSTVVCVDCGGVFGGGGFSCGGWTSDRSRSSRVGDLLLVPPPFLGGLLLHPQGNFGMVTLGKPVLEGWLVACCGMLMDGVSKMPMGGFGLETGGFFGFDRRGFVL